MRKIGPHFGQELKDAGLFGLPFSWDENGLVNVDQLTAQQIADLMLLVDAHDPSVPGPAPKLNDLEDRIADVIEIFNDVGVPAPAQAALQRMTDWLTNRTTPRTIQ